jgi:putative oxidoreductase
MNDSAKYTSWGIAVLRFAVGLVFLAHGAQKLFVYGLAGTGQAFAHMGIPLPGSSAAVVAFVEFFGGVALILGLIPRVAALLLVINMAVAILKVHLKNGFFLPTGFEYAFTLLAANIALVLTGPGAFALSSVLGSTKRSIVSAHVKQAA